MILRSVKIIFLAIGLAIAFLSLFLIGLPNIAYLRSHEPVNTRFMEIYLDDHPDNVRYIWTDYSLISSNVKRAVLAAEDDTFFDHDGFNWKSVKDAARKNWKAKSFKHGGSTITQQLVKNLYLSPSKNPFRKLREWIITYQMEHTLTKDRIFELYLNVVEWGEGIYGVEAAARSYFGKSAGHLSLEEASYLAALLPNPKRFSQPKYSRTINRRASVIAQRAAYVLLK